jgi:hypothetical protein
MESTKDTIQVDFNLKEDAPLATSSSGWTGKQQAPSRHTPSCLEHVHENGMTHFQWDGK